MKTEIWKDVVGYEGLYQVSNLGNVRSVDHVVQIKRGEQEFKALHKGKQLTPLIRQHGYLGVQLYGRGGHATRNLRTCSIHRLVAEAFIPNPNGYEEVNHLDETRTNNCVDNLEWCNHVQNSNYGTRPQRIGNMFRNNKNRSKAIAQYTQSGELVCIYPSLHEADRNGYAAGNICRCAKNDPKYQHAYGYIWKYVD